MIYIYTILLITLLLPDQIQINQYYATVNIDDRVYDRPFLGGFNKPKIQWVDWDYDGDEDLFVLDEDGVIKLYTNNSNPNGLCIHCL